MVKYILMGSTKSTLLFFGMFIYCGFRNKNSMEVFMFLVATIQNQISLAKDLFGMNNIFTSFANSYILGIVYILLPIIGYWFLFEKKGESGWKNLIPFYGSYMQYKLFFNTGKWWRQFLASILFYVFLVALFVGLAMFNVDEMFSQAAFICMAAFVGMFIAFIWLIVIAIQYDISICKKYGRGVWFILGMIFFGSIFVAILAYEVYRGRAKEVKKKKN